jgi:hypothetical protein
MVMENKIVDIIEISDDETNQTEREESKETADMKKEITVDIDIDRLEREELEKFFDEIGSTKVVIESEPIVQQPIEKDIAKGEPDRPIYCMPNQLTTHDLDFLYMADSDDDTEPSPTNVYDLTDDID